MGEGDQAGNRSSDSLFVSFNPFMTGKKLLRLLPLSVLLYACPFESKVPLAHRPTEPVDTSMFGYWYGIVKDGSDYFGIEALEITRHSDSTYNIIRYGKAVKGDIILPDTAYFTGYTSYIGEQRFMNIEGYVLFVTPRRNKQPEYRKEKVYYLSALENRNDTLTVKTITEDFSVRKEYATPQQLREMISALINQQKNIYDDQYSLSYRKIERPKQAKGF